jgi:Ca-activated chloride channel family protein
MKSLLIMITLALILSFAMSQSQKDPNKIDDWDYNATMPQYDQVTTSAQGGGLIKSMTMSSPPIAAPAPMAMSRKMATESIGFSVGGAKDADNFYKNIDNGYLPKIDSITYEGTFYDHYFDTGKSGKCQNLFCPSYSTAISKNIYTQEDEYYLTVGLDSNIKKSDFARKPLNIVVVLDISGSMSSSFNRYYYDGGKKIELSEREQKDSKMKIANETIVDMIDRLAPHDRLGVVLFDHQAYKAKPLRPIKQTDTKAIKDHVLELTPRGGTNWSEGYKEGMKLFDTITLDSAYENRIIFITDAMPNRGELRKKGLFGMIKSASEKKIYTSVIGVGVDFNNDLVEAVTKTKGANYFSIHSSKEFAKRLDKEFDYLVTPLVFDLKLSLDSSAYSIDSVYGAPKADIHNGKIFEVDTLFPSDSSNEGVKGGVILVKLKKTGQESGKVNLKVTYKDRNDKPFEVQKSVGFKEGNYHDNSGIKKAIDLTRYVTLMKNWLLDTRAACSDKVEYPPIHILREKCMIYPPHRPIYPNISTWERKSCKLQVSDGYKKLFSIFKSNFDPKLKKEYNTVEKLLSAKSVSDKIDDWELKK